MVPAIIFWSERFNPREMQRTQINLSRNNTATLIKIYIHNVNLRTLVDTPNAALIFPCNTNRFKQIASVFFLGTSSWSPLKILRFLRVDERGKETRIDENSNKDDDCIYGTSAAPSMCVQGHSKQFARFFSACPEFFFERIYSIAIMIKIVIITSKKKSILSFFAQVPELISRAAFKFD